MGELTSALHSFTRALRARGLRPDYVRRDFTAEEPDLVWAGDLTEIETGESKLYLATVIDLFSRRLLGYAMAERHDADLVVASLNMAAAARGGDVRGVIMHTDRGSTPVSNSPLWQRSPASACPSAVPGSAGTTHSPSRSSPPSNGSCSTREPGSAGPSPAPRSSSSSRAGTTCTDCIAASATAVPPNTRPHPQPEHHTDGIRQSGTSSPGQVRRLTGPALSA
jgi:hypothetical protein